MVLKVRRFSGMPDFEELPVAKLTRFPLEPREYKPYSQVRICFDGEGALHVQLLSFEAHPLPESAMEAIFRFPGSQDFLSFSLNSLGEFSIRTGDADFTTRSSGHYIPGEDLQGIYWGGNLCFPGKLLERQFPGFAPLPGSRFSGNFYKVCDAPQRPHWGSFFPADFSHARTEAANLGEMVVIDY